MFFFLFFFNKTGVVITVCVFFFEYKSLFSNRLTFLLFSDKQSLENTVCVSIFSTNSNADEDALALAKLLKSNTDNKELNEFC